LACIQPIQLSPFTCQYILSSCSNRFWDSFFLTDLNGQKYLSLHFSISSAHTEHETILWLVCDVLSQAMNWLVHFPL
jgi:hypothetical protein